MMLGKLCVPAVLLAGCLCALSQPRLLAEEDASSGFRDVLEMAELGPEVLAEFPDDQVKNWEAEDWRILIRLLHRLGQYPAAQQADWALAWSEPAERLAGDLVEVVGTVESVEIFALPESLAEAHDLKSVFRCRFRFEETGTVGTVLSARIPSDWQAGEAMAEPIGFRGILLRNSAEEPQAEALFLTPYLAWYPRQGVPPGQLLLARQGMDVALLEEVKHGKPFVGPEVSREGEAFYACLAAMKQVDLGELSTLAKKSVALLADRWRESKSADRQQRAIAAQVLKRSEMGLSSVAPLFLQPKQMMGRLVRIEGTARRAVQIAVTDQSELDSYYELEIFPPDSQNHPIVCCVNRLPAEFPTGDTLREPVRMTGVFFKGWLYRSREIQSTEGETGRQQRLITPVVVGSVEWLPRSAGEKSWWGLWGGIAFLVILAAVVLNAVRLARKERRARAARRELESVDLPKIDL